LPDQEPLNRLGHVSPGRLSRQLEGELDDIVIKALRKRPETRYKSARQFAADLVAYREGRAVLAHHDPWWTRLLSASSRYRVIVGVLFVLMVLISTGGITLHASALPYGLGALGLIGIWTLLSDPIAARWLANRVPLHQPYSVVLLMVAVSLLLISMPERYAVWLQTMFYTSLAIYSAVPLTTWSSRARWAGRLVFDASGVPSRTFVGLLAPVWIGPQLIETLKQPRLEAILQLASLSLVIAAIWVFDDKLEFRDRGIVHVGRLIPWDEIESWSWESDTRSLQFLFRGSGAEAVVLKIDRRRALYFLPPYQIRVSPVQVDNVQRVMEQYLSEWPLQPQPAHERKTTI
jgi:hypothetical protein